MNTKKCSKCNGIMYIKQITYKDKVYGKDITIENIEGYHCPECGNVEPSEAVKPYIKERLIEEKLKLLKNSQVEPIFINYIEKIRNNWNLSQKELAEAFKFTEQRYGAIERNVNTPTVFINYQLAELLDVSTDDLYKLVYISEDFYNKLINTAIVEDPEEPKGYRFEYIKEAEETRNALKDIRAKIYEKTLETNALKRKQKSKDITKKEYEEIEKQIKEIERFKKINYYPIKKELENKMKEIESKYRFVIKREHTIMWDDWEKVKETFKEELENPF